MQAQAATRRQYQRTNRALFLAGFSTFALLYCVQPLLPTFSLYFGVGAATSSLPLSVATASLAFAIFLSGPLSPLFSPRRVMFCSMAGAALMNIAAAVAPGWGLLLAVRVIQGLFLGGVPAVAMAYLAEHVDSKNLGRSVGTYVAGNAFGGMMGRVAMGFLTEWTSWRFALGAVGVAGLLAAAAFLTLLPADQAGQTRMPIALRDHVGLWRRHLRNSALRRLFAIGFLALGIQVAVFNYAGFRLGAEPYHLGEAAISAVYLVYGAGMFTSSFAGRMADRLGGRRPLMAGLLLMACGIALTLMDALAAVVAGIAVVTAGFFMAHSVASGWVGRIAEGGKSHATSLYLLSYYLGSAVIGSAAGWFWETEGWWGVAGSALALSVVALGIASTFHRQRN